MSELEPLVVSVKEARRLLGGIGHNQIWKIIATGQLDVVGSERKRFVTVASIRNYVDQLPRRKAVVHDAQRTLEPEITP